MRRHLLLVVVLCLLGSMTGAPAGAEDYPCALVQTGVIGNTPDFARFVSVLPPGQNGDARLDIPSTDVNFGRHFDDQLAMYGDLVYQTPMSGGPGISDAQVPTFFKEAGLNPAGCESVKVVGPGTIVMRTNFGVPHVYGQAAEAVAFGAGYVTAEDRMFQADLFRNAARGTLSTLLGPSFLEMDKVARRDGYTEAELQAQIANLEVDFPTYGNRIARGLEAFAAGFNARIVEVLTDVRCNADSGGTVCPGLPVEYIGTGNLPLPWRATDTVAEAVLLARQFGEFAGAEVRNAGLYSGLIAAMGDVEGPKAFNDIRWLNDPGANTTVPPQSGAFTYPNTGAVDPDAIVLPDHAAGIAYGDTNVILQLSKVFTEVTGQPWPASNAMLVAPSESATGNSLQLGDPQVGYAVPQYLMEIGLHGGGFEAEGMTFPGVSGFVLIGHGLDYAWTVTSGISDAVDVRVEKLCDPTGAPPAAEAAFYVFNGECVPMEVRVETILVKNTGVAADENAPEADLVLQRVERTRHGPVFARDTVDGVPVALTKERAFWGRELDNAVAFGKFNFPEFITSAASFGDAASAIVVTLNLYYADKDSVGYWHTGRYPVRAPGVDTRLPTWGTGEWEWEENPIPFSAQPQFISDADSPDARNYTSNWNNKPSTGWANGDDTNYGEIHRVDALMTQMDSRLADDGKMSFVDVINVMNNAATVDSRAAKLGPLVISNLNSSGGGGDCSCLGQVIDTLKDWFEAGPVGGHRIDLDKNGFYDSAPAIRLWDAINEALVEEIFFDQIPGLRGQLGQGTVDYPGPGGSAFFDGMFNHVLHVLDPSPSLPTEHDWLNGETASHVVGRAVDRALAALSVESASELDALTMPREEIVFASQGAHDPYRIHWVNRGTWTHIAEITGRRTLCADCLPLP